MIIVGEDDFKRILRREALNLGVVLDDTQVDVFLSYKNLLLDWNTRINLTAVTDDASFLVKHYLDSLSVCRYIPKKSTVIDVGTGAGFPGIPIKIAIKDTAVTLLDSLNKRLKFITEVIERLNLVDVRIIHSRAEDAGISKGLRESFDVVVSRAVAGMSLLSEYCLPLVKLGGIFIAMKGPNSLGELEDANDIIEKLGGVLSATERIILPSVDGDDGETTRNILIIRKLRHTSAKYPRKSAELSRVYKKK